MVKRIWLLSILIILSVGCAPSGLLQQYTIVITSSDGYSVTYNVMSHQKPRMKIHWDGQSTFIDYGTSQSHDWERDIVVPAGWLAEVKEGKISAEKSNDKQ